jgi:hypothetical protein
MQSSWVPLRLDVSAEPQQRIIDTVLIDTTTIGGADPSSRLAYGLIADALVQPMIRNGRSHFTGRVDSSHLTTLWKQGTRQFEEQFRAIREMQQQSEEQEEERRREQQRRREQREDDPPCHGGPAESTWKRGEDTTTPNDITNASQQEQQEPNTKKQKTWHDSTTTMNSSSAQQGSIISGPPQHGETTVLPGSTTNASSRQPTPPAPQERRKQQPPEHIIPIHLRLCFNGIYVHDDFDWDVSLARHMSPLDIATRLADDLNLAEDAIPILATAIVEQIYGISMLHQLDEDETERTTAAWPVPAHSNINHAAIVSRNHPPTTAAAAKALSSS